jgi:AbiV family abortive infection protein
MSRSTIRNERRYPIKGRDMSKGIELVLRNVKKRLHNSKLLLYSLYPDDAFVLYSYACEEFGKALIIKDHIKKKKDGLPKWLFKAHDKKMARTRKYLPAACSNFTPWVRLLHPNDKTETVNYKVWRRKGFQQGTISGTSMTTGDFADTTNVSSTFDEITREELLLVNYDPKTNEWHMNPVYSIDQLKQGIALFEERLMSFARRNKVNLE